MSKLLVLKGLPSSGKSTFARELVAKGWKRVNKDDLRAMIDFGGWSSKNEAQIQAVEKDLAGHYLGMQYDVVVDDTNFGWEESWREFADNYNADFEIKFFDVQVMECVERDAKRGDKSVGAKVIFRMYNKYLKPKEPAWDEDKHNCYIFDIDGTLALMNGRSPYDATKVDTDIPNHDIAMICRTLKNSGLPIIIVSGRTDDCKEQTMQWLSAHSIPFDEIHMRKTGDSREDSIIKREIYDTQLKDRFNILAVFDDRDRVIWMWRSLGLTVLQVAYGAF